MLLACEHPPASSDRSRRNHSEAWSSQAACRVHHRARATPPSPAHARPRVSTEPRRNSSTPRTPMMAWERAASCSREDPPWLAYALAVALTGRFRLRKIFPWPRLARATAPRGRHQSTTRNVPMARGAWEIEETSSHRQRWCLARRGRGLALARGRTRRASAEAAQRGGDPPPALSLARARARRP
ncbi:hypothetical protein PHLGIDRAFT_238953 [Phlebiopsis gigantea 11061_1 CR5-6]|uniref:Uncharacterized protein n=1 Tax=Phlebiopsis gigantea (strain 11061_1 CR5-6) TaxID=745531 RepID=A0A0C3S1X8_PHLG1|nr:hypothetical protein PHLGIDRAFT_238953 [Phlebiopsis gigantea 11061_1 CR5-6]